MTDQNYAAHIKAVWNGKSDTKLADLWKWAREPDDPERQADRWKALKEWAGEHKRNAEDGDKVKAWRRRQRIYANRERKARDKAATEEVPPMVDGGWHPDAIRTGVVAPVGPFLSGIPKRLVWHTTEGSSLPTYAGSNPHFTLDARNGTLYQHQSVSGASRTLRNDTGGVETNRQGAIQVEVIGFASQSPNWSDGEYAELAELARWIEARCGVARRCDVAFVAGRAEMSASKWQGYSGHCGHQHIPENDHWDPGAMKIAKVLDD